MLFNALAPIATASTDNRMLFCTSSGYQWIVGNVVEPEVEQECLKCIYSSDTELDILSRPSLCAFSQIDSFEQGLSHTIISDVSLDTKLPRAPPKNL